MSPGELLTRVAEVFVVLWFGGALLIGVWRVEFRREISWWDYLAVVAAVMLWPRHMYRAARRRQEQERKP